MQAGRPSGSPRARNGPVTLYFRGSCLSQLPAVENCVTLSASLLEPARRVVTWAVDQIRAEIDFTLIARPLQLCLRKEEGALPEVRRETRAFRATSTRAGRKTR